MTHLTLHVSRKDVEDPTTTLGWVAETMADLDYLYNILAIPDLVEQGRIASSSLVMFNDALMQTGFGVPPQTINSSIRPLVPPTAQAQLETLQVGMSFDIKIDGSDKVIDALARIFDRARRRAQKEDDRHRQTMNRLEEEDRRTEVLERQLEVVARYSDDPRFDPIVRRHLGIDSPMASLKDNMIHAAGSAITSLDQTRLKWKWLTWRRKVHDWHAAQRCVTPPNTYIDVRTERDSS
jgi:hypothetical protein